MYLFAFFILSCAARTITLLFTDANYAEMTRDLIQDIAKFSGGKTDLKERVEVWATSDVDYRFLAPLIKFQLPSSVQNNYQQLLVFRVAAMVSALEHPGLNATGYLLLDSDVVLFRNLADRLDKLDCDVAFQTDMPCFSSLGCVNGGIWWARTHNDRALAFVRRSLDIMKSLSLPDQDAFDVAISADKSLRVCRLPPQLYANGFVHEANDRINASRVHLVHVNWCTYANKHERLRAIRSVRGRKLNLSTPHDSNRTRICTLLNDLDIFQLRQIFDCKNAFACRLAVSRRCFTTGTV